MQVCRSVEGKCCCCASGTARQEVLHQQTRLCITERESNTETSGWGRLRGKEFAHTSLQQKVVFIILLEQSSSKMHIFRNSTSSLERQCHDLYKVTELHPCSTRFADTLLLQF